MTIDKSLTFVQYLCVVLCVCVMAEERGGLRHHLKFVAEIAVKEQRVIVFLHLKAKPVAQVGDKLIIKNES